MKADSPRPPDEPDTPSDYRFQPIGIVHSCFREKFGIPRQPGLVHEAGARLELLPPFGKVWGQVNVHGRPTIIIIRGKIFIFMDVM